MGYPTIVVNTYTDSPSGHTNVTFYDSNGAWVGTYGSNLGISQMPGEMGGVYNENPARTPSYAQSIVFTDPSQAAWNNALTYAQTAVSMTAGGAGEYFPIGNNCYDFVDNVLVQAGFPNSSAYQFMEPGSLVRTYGEVQHDMLNAFDYLYQLFTNDPEAAYQYTPMVQQYNHFLEVRSGWTEYDGETITVNARIERLEQETWVSPIAIDLGGDGFEIVNLADSDATFDFYQTGQRLKAAWLGNSDGFLVNDSNHDGYISDLSEMFGGAGYGQGFAKLSTFDSNLDGIVSQEDAHWSDLQIWIDSDGDGISNERELHNLSDVGVQVLSLDSQKSSVHLGDGYIAETAEAEVYGEVVELSDIFFRLGGAAMAADFAALSASSDSVLP
jgi:hypothetical protein